MSTKSGSSVVQDSLSLSIDPANYKSYNGENNILNLCLYPEDMSYFTSSPNYTASTPNVINAPDGTLDRKSTRLNSSHIPLSRMPSSA